MGLGVFSVSRYMLGLAAVPAVIQLLGFVFMPESPRWLVAHGKIDSAENVLKKIRGTPDVNSELQDILRSHEDMQAVKVNIGESSHHLQ